MVANACAAAPMLLLVILATTGAVDPGSFKKVLNWGDSWAWLGRAELELALKPHGIKVATKAIPGAPVAAFAATPDVVSKAIKKTGAEAVVLSIGGNDFLEGM